jgi:hypothetical protein
MPLSSSRFDVSVVIPRPSRRDIAKHTTSFGKKERLGLLGMTMVMNATNFRLMTRCLLIMFMLLGASERIFVKGETRSDPSIRVGADRTIAKGRGIVKGQGVAKGNRSRRELLRGRAQERKSRRGLVKGGTSLD